MKCVGRAGHESSLLLSGVVRELCPNPDMIMLIFLPNMTEYQTILQGELAQ